MKHLTLLLAALIFTGYAYSQITGSGFLSYDTASYQWYHPKLDSTCIQRGHVYEKVREDVPLLTIGYATYYKSDDFPLVLIDTPDSSYIVKRQLPQYKHCYRCHQDIEQPVKDTYIKTIWRK